MPPERTSKSLSDRVDIDSYARPVRLRRFGRRLSLAVLIGTLLLVALALSHPDRRIYQARPLTEPHRVFERDCHRCHATPWQPLARMFDWGKNRVSTPDGHCLVCHSGPPHHANQLPPSLNCADCHREHRDNADLTRVPDGFCTRCHAGLKTKAGDSVDFERAIADFSGHPEFAVWRSDAPPGPAHSVHLVAQRVDGKFQDQAKIELNHAMHLNPRGLLRLDGTWQRLSCTSCHVADAASGYIQPIKYERHCSACHSNMLHFDGSRFADTPVPHGGAAEAVGFMMERYGQLAAEHPDLASDRPLAKELEMPGRPPRIGAQGWEWTNERVENASRILFEQKGLGCQYCHTGVHDSGSGWTVDNPRIPDRWFVHARFRHDRHRLLSCTSCHERAGGSQLTSDILLPKIATCRKCHGNETSANSAGSARSDCTHCHRYHDRKAFGSDFDGPMDLELKPVRPADQVGAGEPSADVANPGN